MEVIFALAQNALVSTRQGLCGASQDIGSSHQTIPRRGIVGPSEREHRRRRNVSDEAKRAARAMSLVQVGELSAARQALEGAALAPGNLATLNIDEFLFCLHKATRGAASGPSSMTSDHLFPILENVLVCSVRRDLFWPSGTFHRPFCRRSGWGE